MPKKDFIFDLNESVDNNPVKSEQAKRILFAAIGQVLFEGKSGIKIEGTKLQLESIVDVVRSTREFNSEINRPNATIATITSKLEEKNRHALAFESAVGIKWPL